ncbi:MAG: helix-turn-helix domain-containing protein [Candidatus Diapherotrites archaeon]|nr:helix-turn-helix domain-containing protein [Candidatus Diapherotrites archaeon]
MYTNKGYSLREIAKTLGVSHMTVYRALKQLGCTMHPTGRRKKQRKRGRPKVML